MKGSPAFSAPPQSPVGLDLRHSRKRHFEPAMSHTEMPLKHWFPNPYNKNRPELSPEMQKLDKKHQRTTKRNMGRVRFSYRQAADQCL